MCPIKFCTNFGKNVSDWHKTTIKRHSIRIDKKKYYPLLSLTSKRSLASVVK